MLLALPPAQFQSRGYTVITHESLLSSNLLQSPWFSVPEPPPLGSTAWAWVSL